MDNEKEINKAVKEIDFMLNVLRGEIKVNCKNCQYSGYQKGEIFITCGFHISNFKATSLCTDFKQKKTAIDGKKMYEPCKKFINYVCCVGFCGLPAFNFHKPRTNH